MSHACAIKETAKELHCLELGTRYKALSAEATTAYGLHPALCIFDELGQVRGARSALFEALETATGAQQDPLTIIISTQAPNDNDLLSILIDDALAGHDPRTDLPALHRAARGRPVRGRHHQAGEPGVRRLHESGRGPGHGQ